MLWSHIQDLPESEQFKYAFVTSFIKVNGKKTERFQNINIHHKVWLNIIGSKYPSYINKLKEWNIISIQLNENGKETYKKAQFAKCYSITIDANKSGWILREYNKRKAKVVKSKLMAGKNKNNLSDPIINYTYRSIQLLYIYNINIFTNNTHTAICLDESELETVSDVIDGECWYKNLETNNYNIKYGENCGRLYHPVICMPKAARENLWFKDSDVVLDYDIKSCFPVLLMAIVDDLEKDKYKKILDGDIYSRIIDGTKHNREDCKAAFQQFSNGFVSNYVSDWFEQHFPLTFQIIKADYVNMSKRLQSMESTIMVQGLINFCIQKGYEGMVICHDGWMNSGSFGNDSELVDYVKEEIFKMCGYVPTIKLRRRHKNENTPLPLKENSDGKTITDEEQEALLENLEYRRVFNKMCDADRVRKQLAKRLHHCKNDTNLIRKQRVAKQRYINYGGKWVKFLENFLQINKK